MKGTGRLAISLIEHKRKLIIEVSDTGPGLSRGQASQVFEPFYTTKQSAGSNFGLGLSYCYAVMRKHRGELQLRTAPGEGAAFSMIFGKRAAAAELAVAVQAERSEAVGQ